MSKRTSITKALAEQLKVIDGSTGYNTDISNNSYPKLKYWDEVMDFPAIYSVAGSEGREYLPGNFAWGHLGIAIKVYCKGEDSLELLELLIEDIEKVINSTKGVLVYDTVNNYSTSEISITSIVTDEGLLAPYAIGEINLQVMYQVM